MKNILLLIFLFVCAFKLHAEPDSVSVKINILKADLDATNKRLDNNNDSIAAVKAHVDSAIQNQLIVDQSALDSAKKAPMIFLYKTYLFSPGKKTALQYFFAILAFIVLFFLWFGAIRYSINDGLIKDPSYRKDGSIIPVKSSPFSYARTQLLWWTLIILTCYVFLFGSTGVLAPLNVTAVVLLGFGAVVYSGGKIIDNRQILQSKGDRTQDEDAQQYAQDAKKDPPPKPDFLNDILSDDNGISIHRFQAVFFNVVFGIGFIGFFIKSVGHDYPFPDFTEWQFSLLGISSATYLGMKASENNPQNSPTSTNGSKNDQQQDNSLLPDQPVG